MNAGAGADGASDSDLYWMGRALALAARAAEAGEVPVGAVLVRDGVLLAGGFNRPVGSHDPTAHAEIVALRAATAAVANYRLAAGCTLYATLEPCAMCAGALVQARVSRVVFGAGDSRNGACGSVFDVLRDPTLNHRAEIRSGVLAPDCAQLLRGFFRRRRQPARDSRKPSACAAAPLLLAAPAGYR